MDKNIYRLYKEQFETPWDKPWGPTKNEKKDYYSELMSMLSMPYGEILITVVGIKKYLGNEPFEMCQKVHLVKEPDNKFDFNAIAVFCDYFGKCGYVANSCTTVKQGTFFADLIYGGIGDGCTAEVLWADDSFVICKLCGIDNYKFVFNHAVDYCYDKKYDMAIELFLGLEKIAENIEVVQRICDCYIKLERYEDALKYIDMAVALDKDDNRIQLMKNAVLEKLKGE